MNKTHQYTTVITWTGNTGEGTTSYTAYSRNHTISVDGKESISASSDPAFRGDAGRYNPEELLVASLSSCHMLWFLHLCADKGVVVTAYEDHPTGVMEEGGQVPGRFTEVTLNPIVTVAQKAQEALVAVLHEKAHAACFIANSVNFKVYCKGRTVIG